MGNPKEEAILPMLPSFLVLAAARCPCGAQVPADGRLATAARSRRLQHGVVVSVAEGFAGGQSARQHPCAAQTSCVHDAHFLGPASTTSTLVI